MKRIGKFTEKNREWLEARKQGIGGSDIAAVCGINPYSSPLSIYMQKVGNYEQEESNAMKMGKLLEPVVRQLFVEETGKKVKANNYMLRHDDYAHCLADIDCETVGEKAVVELKTTNTFNFNQWQDDVPPWYVLQVQWYMFVMGYEKSYIGCLMGNKDFIAKEIHRDDNLIKVIKERADDFWENFVLKKIPPIAVNASDNDLMSNIYPEAQKTTIQLPAETYDIISDRIKLKQKEKEIKTKIAVCDARIKAEMGENESGAVGDYEVTWRNETRILFDKSKFLKEHSELYHKFTKESKSRKFTIKGEDE